MAAANLKIAAAADLEAMLLEESRLLREKAARQPISKAAPMTIADLADGIFDTLKAYIDKRLAGSRKDSLNHWHPVNPSTVEALEAMLEHQKKLQRELEILEQRFSILESRR